MKTVTTLLGLFMCTIFTFSQTQPKVYINFVSHNEPDDQLQNTSNYNAMKVLVMQLADTMDAKGAAWNLQTCAGFVQGAITVDGFSNNLFRTLATSPYLDNIEIDPRYKSNTFGTLADLYHVMGELGANRTHTLGGFLVEESTADWYEYESPQLSTSSFYPQESWQCEIMWGAASMNHTNDIDDWGIWKPDNVSTFYTHNSNNPIWYIGNGCSPDGTTYPSNPASFDPTDNVSDVIDPLRRLIDSIANHQLPWDKFYNYSITINQSGFGSTLFSKIATVCDSINAMNPNQVQWALLTEKLTEFESWSNANTIEYSQWNCGDVYEAAIPEIEKTTILISPNPTSDQLNIVLENSDSKNGKIYNYLGGEMIDFYIVDSISISTLNWPNGIYFIKLEDGSKLKFEVIR